MGKNDSIDYDNLTYDDIFNTIKKLGINMCNDEKLLKHQLKNKRKAKYEMRNFCEQYSLPPIAHSRQKSKKHDKSHKKYRNNFVKPNDFYAKKKNISKKYVKQRSGKGKCFNCSKSGHFGKDCKEKPSKLKNKFNMLNIDDKENKKSYSESLNRTTRLILWKMIFLLHLILTINLLMILLILLILKLVVEILVAMLLKLLMLSLRVKKMKN